VAPITPFYRRVRAFSRALFACWFRWRRIGLENIPATGPVLLAANHVSFIDPPMIGSAVDRTVSFLARDTLFDVPVVGTVIRKLNSVPVDRDGGGGAGLKAILDRLKAGGCIVLFPEGTRSRDGQLQRAKSGVGLSVLKSEAVVVPVRMFGAFEAFGRHRKFPLPGQITLKFGPPMSFDRERAEAASCSKARLKELYQEVADRVMAGIAAIELAEPVSRFPPQ
jgi:1-acyl-sn-glycerol-3-phosphate acyltransferase